MSSEEKIIIIIIKIIIFIIDARCHTGPFPKPIVNVTVQPLTANDNSNVLFTVDTGAAVLSWGQSQ